MITLAELQYLISTLRLAKGLVIAGLGDIQRPAEKLSVSQSSALAATGVVWSRYSLVIIPKNWSLFSVNVFVAITNFYQLTRAVRNYVI
ncbi:mitochondrial pyruvate carrier 2-like isoform X2 [Lycorma delicatula]|uniref:mitochondrial pyruvate carrier 2-like isoform X2 n=1 Tax=Lycorma delicatula TaxID=130591 RepID=UPI003F513469